MGGHALDKGLHLVDDIFNRGVETHLGSCRALGGRLLDGVLHELIDAGVLQGGNFYHGAAQLVGKLGHIDFVAVLLHQIGHIERHHYGQAQVYDLRGEVQVALEVCGVNQIDYRIGTILDQVVAAHDLLGRIRRKRIDTRQVRDGHALVAYIFTLFFLNGHTGPVAHVLRCTGEAVEQRCLAAVRIAGKRYAKSHPVYPFFHAVPDCL